MSDRELSAAPLALPIALTLASITGATVSVAAVTVGLYALGIGGLIAANALLGQKGQSGDIGPLNTNDVRFSTRQPTPPKRVIYGTALVGGALCFEQVTAPYLYQLFAVAVGEITGFRGLKIGTNEVAIARSGTYFDTGSVITPQGNLATDPDTGALSINASPDYATYLRCAFRTGSTSQTVDPVLLAGYPDIDTNFRQLGVATVGLRFQHGGSYDTHQALWGNSGQPGPLFLVDGLAIPDPRDPTQIVEYDPNDSDEVAAAKATWKFSNNAALVQAHYLTQWYGGRIDPRRIDWDKVAIAAEYDDEVVGVRSTGRIVAFDAQTANFTVGDVVTGASSGASGIIESQSDGGATGTLTLTNCKGSFIDNETITDNGGGSATVNGTPTDTGPTGFIRRHTIDGVLTLNQSPAEVMKGMLAANRGFVVDSGSKVWVTSSKPKTPIVTIYDKILTGGIEYRAQKPKKEIYNRVKVRFVADGREYNIADGPILSSSTDRTADGELLDATLELPFTLDHRRAQRIQKAYLAASRLGKSITCRVDVGLLGECADDLIGAVATFSSDLFSQANGTYLITQVAFTETFSELNLTLSEYDSSIETDWDYATDEKDFNLVPVT